jgi:hypothetical protein
MLSSSPTLIYLGNANKNIIAFRYICFMNGLVKTGLQILGVNDLVGEYKPVLFNLQTKY